MGRESILPLPRSEGSETPAPVSVLQAHDVTDEGLVLIRCQKIREFAGSPKQHDSVQCPAAFQTPLEIRTERRHMLLDSRRSRVVVRRHSDRNGREGSSEVSRPFRFPRGQSEVEPSPTTGFFSSGELKFPQILKRLSSFAGQLSLSGITAG